MNEDAELILVVDDMAANRYSFVHTLSAAGYRVVEAGSGDEAFERLAQETPDLILLDVLLPDRSGHEICGAIKSTAEYRSIPIIQTSANYTTAEDYSHGVDSGADAYLTSPVDPLILLSNVRAWLRVKRLNAALQEQMRRQQEQETREKEWLNRLIGMLPFPVVLLQPSGALQRLNEAAATFFEGLPADANLCKLYGQTFWLEDPDSGKRLKQEDLPKPAELSTGSISGRELMLHIGGKRFYIVLDLKLVPSPGEGSSFLYLVSFLDVSALHENRVLLASTVEELHREKVLREQFVATLTHDLRTPLSTISINTEILRVTCGGDDQARRVLDMMQSNLKRASEMVANLLDFHKVLSGHPLPIRREPCELGALVRAVAQDMSALYGDRFKVKASGGIHGLCDAVALRRVLENLLSNAVKYGDQTTPVTVTLGTRDGHALIAVHNWGNPIGDAERRRLFVPFQRSQDVYNPEQHGWGLGLTIVKGLLEAHGGAINVESDAQRGTTFTLDLPLVTVSA